MNKRGLRKDTQNVMPKNEIEIKRVSSASRSGNENNVGKRQKQTLDILTNATQRKATNHGPTTNTMLLIQNNAGQIDPAPQVNHMYFI